MDDCSLSPVILGIVYVVATAAFAGNVAHLLSVKPPRRGANASDVLQWAKTGVALMVLVVVVPLQTTTFTYGERGYNIVATTSLLHHLLVDFYPLGLLALAVTRLRVCLCRGNADILVTKMSALLTLGLCFLPLAVSVVLKALITASHTSTSDHSTTVHYCLNSTAGLDQTLHSSYRLFTIITFDIIPIVMTFIIYGVIQKKYRKSESNSQRRQTVFGMQRRITIVQHTRRNGRSIGLSVRLLASTILLAWVPYVALELFTWFGVYQFEKSIHHAITLFTIVILYLLSPIAEGVFLRQKRENISELFKQMTMSIQSRIQVDVLTSRNAGPVDNGFNGNDGRTSMQTPVFIIDNSGKLSAFEQSEHQPASASDVNPEHKKRRVCFSSDLEPENLRPELERRMSVRSQVSRRRKHSSTVRPTYSRQSSQNVSNSCCKHRKTSHQQYNGANSMRNSFNSQTCSHHCVNPTEDQHKLRCGSDRHIYQRRKVSLANLNMPSRRVSQSLNPDSATSCRESVCYCNSTVSWMQHNPDNSQILQRRLSNGYLSPILCSSPQICAVPVVVCLKDVLSPLPNSSGLPSPSIHSFSSEVFTPGVPSANPTLQANNLYSAPQNQGTAYMDVKSMGNVPKSALMEFSGSERSIDGGIVLPPISREHTRSSCSSTILPRISHGK